MNKEDKLKEIVMELERRKLMNPLSFFENLEMQQLFDECPSKIKGLFGGNRSGKTEKGAEYVLKKCLDKPKQKWWCCAESFKDSVEVQQSKIWKLIPKDKLKYAKYDEVNGFTNRKLIFTNGSSIIFKSYDQEREAFQGADLDGILNDEEPPYSIYREQRMRLLDRDGELLFTMTSLKGITALLADIFDEHDVKKSQYAPLVDKDLPRIVEKQGMTFFMLWTTENPYINQDRTLQDAKLMTKQEITSRIYGMPMNLAGKIFMNWNYDVHVIEPEDVPADKFTLYNILDPHDRKPWALTWIAVDEQDVAYVFDEYPAKNFNEMLYDDKTYDDYAKVIKDKEAVYKHMMAPGTEIIRIIDPNYGNKATKLAIRQGGQSSTTIKKELQKRGLYYSDGIDALEAGHLKVREALHWQEKDGELIVHPKLYVCSNCQNTIRHASRYSRKDITTSDGDEKDKVKPMEKYKDFCFIAGTMIRIQSGIVPIENIRLGDLVETDIGLRRVIRSQITGHNRPTLKVTFSNGQELCGTPNHKVYLKNGLNIPLDLLRYGDIMESWEERKHITGRLGRADIINSALGSFIVRYGKSITERFLKDSISIISTGISSIMQYLTLNFFQSRSIGRNIHCQKNNERREVTRSGREQSNVRRWQHGTKAKKAGHGLLNISKRYGRIEHRIREFVNTAMKSLKRKFALSLGFAPITARLTTGESQGLTTNNGNVLSATQNLPRINTPKARLVRQDAVVVVKVEPSSRRTVYNITVEGRHRYYANDILVSNCDLLRYFVMSNPKFLREKGKDKPPPRMY